MKINLSEYVLKNSVKSKRLKRGMSQSELAEVMDVSRNSISAIENGDTDVRLFLAMKLCVFFRCKFEDLFRLEKIEK